MRGAMATGSWRGLALLLVLGVCSVSLSAASILPIDGLNQKSQDYTSVRFRHRSLLQATAPTPPPAAVPVPPPRQPPTAPPVTPPPSQPPTAPPVTPPAASVPGIAPVLPPSPAPRAPPAPPTPVRTYLMWIGVGAAILVFTTVAVFCLCRKFGQNKINRGQRLPPLPRYH